MTCWLIPITHHFTLCLQRKCDQYWPTEGEHAYNNIHVTRLDESITAHYIVRKFKLRYAKDRLSIKKARELSDYIV